MKMKWPVLVFIWGMTMIKGVNASEWRHYLAVNLTSYHFNRHKEYNEFNPGLGYEGSYDNWRVLGGVYYNSFKRWTTYLVGGYLPINLQVTENSKVGVGFLLGLATGYQKEVKFRENSGIDYIRQNLGIIPIGGIMLTWEQAQSGFGIDILIIPSIKKYNISGVAGFQIKYAF